MTTRPSVLATSLLLLICSGVAACGTHTRRLELAPRPAVAQTVHPWRVGVVVDKKLMPFKTKFRYWSSFPVTWSLNGLPDALVGTLRPHFLTVETIHRNQDVSTGRHDLIARMSVDRVHFDGANTTVGEDTVDLTMTFILEERNGTELFRTTISAQGSAPYTQPCAFCKADPSDAFTEAFGAVFDDLSERLNAARLERK